MKLKSLIASLVLASVSPMVFAGSHFALETDPYTFVQKGYSLHLKYQPEVLPNWRFGLGVYSLEIPDFMVAMNSKNDNKDWLVDLEQGIGFFADYYFNPNQQGFYIGLQISEQDFAVSNPGHAADFTNGLVMASAGYRYLVGATGWYLQPWLGVGYTTTIAGDNDREVATFDVAPLTAFATLHVGYQF